MIFFAALSLVLGIIIFIQYRQNQILKLACSDVFESHVSSYLINKLKEVKEYKNKNLPYPPELSEEMEEIQHLFLAYAEDPDDQSFKEAIFEIGMKTYTKPHRDNFSTVLGKPFAHITKLDEAYIAFLEIYDKGKSRYQ